MLVTLRTLNQQTFKIEIDPEEKVVDLKKKIEEEKGPTFAVANQKLIYAGKILSDDSKISGCEIDEAKYVVLMVLSPKATPEQTPSATPSAPNKSTSTPASGASGSTSGGQSTESSKTPVKKETSSKEGSASTPSAESNLVLGDQFEEMVRQIMEMGYDRHEVENALKASFNNPERAVEYLINGIPLDAAGNESNPPPAGGIGSGGPTTPAENVVTAASDPSNPLAFLRNQPMFLQMRQIIQADPLALYSLMQQIRETNPQLYELINRNQETFVRMLNDDAGGQATGAVPNPPTLANPTSGTGGGGGGGTPTGFPSGIENLIGTAQITPADKEAIERLKALGFPEYLVIQAYFACDKNENSAANFLLSQAFDD